MQKLKSFLLFLLLLLSVQMAHSQKIILQGKVSGNDGSVLPGANVMVKGTSNGSITDNKGMFSVSAAIGDTLTFSFIGFDNKVVKVKSDKFIDVTLYENSKSIKEVVVTALGVEKRYNSLGYAVQEVKGEDLRKARDQNPITGLTGKVSGLSVGANSEMLRKPSMILRGNTLELYVVDGVPISSDTWNISPDDIETMTVLKGPTAAALYGSRAMNGALLITTKKGNKNKKTTVEINSTNMFENGFLTFPRLQNEYGPGSNQIYMFVDGKGAGQNDNDYDVWGPRFRGQLIPQYDGQYTPNQKYTTTFGDKSFEGNIKPTPWVSRGPNNLENFLRTGFHTTNNIAFTKSGEDYTIRMSISHSDQQAIIPNTGVSITNMNLYGTFQVNKKLTIDANINANYQYSDNFPDVDYGPNSIIYNMSIWAGADWDVNDPKIKGIWQEGKEGLLPIYAEYQRYHNPWAIVNYWKRGHQKKDVFGYARANYVVNSNLNFSLRSQVSSYDMLRTEKMPVWAHPYGREQNLGDYREDRRSLMDMNTDLQANYNFLLGDVVQFTGLSGANIREFSYNSSYASTDYLSVPNVYSLNNSLNPIVANSFQSGMRVISGYSSMDIDLSKYATLSGTARVDKSSAILSQNDTYFYPSVSLSTLVNDYVTLPEVISALKLRGSYAVVKRVETSEEIGTTPSTNIYTYPLGYGQNYLSPYGGPTYALNTESYSQSKPYNNSPAATFSNALTIPGIKPAERINYEGGIDVKFFKNRLGLSATYFQYIDGPKILKNPISSTSGYNFMYVNGLKTKKNGVEISLFAAPIQTVNGFSWEINANWSTFQEVYTELPAGVELYNDFFRVGDRTDKLYSSAFARDPQGNIIHDGSGKPLSYAKSQYLGNYFGDFIWGLNNKFTYKNVYLSFQFDGNVGGAILDNIHKRTMRGGRNIETVEGKYGEARLQDDTYAGFKSYTGTYVGEGVVVSNGKKIEFDPITGAISNMNDLAFAPNTSKVLVQDYVSKYYAIEEGNLMSRTYTKLRELQIGYNLPTKWLTPLGITKATISFVGRNLLYFYADIRFKDVDLDQFNSTTASTGLQTPTTRRFGFNVNIVF